MDTDQIIPARFLKVTEKTGLGKHLFSDWRYHHDGSNNQDFVLNHPESEGAQILIVGDNFGSGSSREHAPWALVDHGLSGDHLDELRGHLQEQRTEERGYFRSRSAPRCMRRSWTQHTRTGRRK